MRTVKIDIEEIEIVDEIICNKCGENCEPLKDFGNEGLIGAKVVAGYGANLLYDGCVYNFDLCEVCTFNLMRTFVHFPDLGLNDIHLEKEDFERVLKDLYGDRDK